MARDLTPGWSTYYEGPDGVGIRQDFHSKESNDAYAQGLELMGVQNITKSYYDRSKRKWYTYRNDNDVNLLNRQVMNRLWT